VATEGVSQAQRELCYFNSSITSVNSSGSQRAKDLPNSQVILEIKEHKIKKKQKTYLSLPGNICY